MLRTVLSLTSVLTKPGLIVDERRASWGRVNRNSESNAALKASTEDPQSTGRHSTTAAALKTFGSREPRVSDPIISASGRALCVGNHAVTTLMPTG